ncbi:MAG: hypothetical protein ACOYOP_02500 [Microthrixaceae bacterium]
MTQVTISELRAAAELGRTVLDARSKAEMGLHLRRLRHLVPFDEARIRLRHPGEPELLDPTPALPNLVEVTETVGEAEVCVSLMRLRPPFDAREAELVDLVRPYLAVAASAVCPEGIELVELGGTWASGPHIPVDVGPEPARSERWLADGHDLRAAAN